MKIRVSIAFALMALLAVPGMLFAQSAPAKSKPAAISVMLEYFENNSGAFEIRDEKGASVTDPQMGDELKLGWTVLTGKGDVAELKMTHTGTIIKIAQNTNLKLDKLRSETGGQDSLSLAVGKIRTVAGKASGKDQYQIKTNSAVCGVRGSDIVLEYQEGSFAKLSTLEGTGWIQSSDGKELDVAQGFAADAMAAAFETVEIAKDVLAALADEMKFVKLSVDDTLAANKEYQKALADAAAAAQASAAASGEKTTAEEKKPESKTPAWLDSIMAKVKEILGMEIGSLTIGGTTYSTVLVQPTFKLGELKTALYLPVIYNGDMFNPNDWYHPLGNDEWSFGTDVKSADYASQTDYYIAVAEDAASDVFLKIKYLEWGDQRDPFFFKLGNLSDITIGHGLIMRNFANDADFPAVRRVGVNVGLDFTTAGIEAMVNDAASPDVFGGRLYVRPIKGFKAALGFSALVDINPGKDWPGGADLVGNPIFINPGVDLDLPFFESDFFSIVAFADGAVMLPYFLTTPTDAAYSGIYGRTKSGLATDAILPNGITDYSDIQNWGVAAGVFGNLIIKDFTWRVEYRDYTGMFIPQFYNSGYERQRTQYLANVLAYLSDPTNDAYHTETMGVFGEGGFTLAKICSMELSYFWPWERDSAGALNMTGFGNDHFVAKFTLEKGVIPVVNLSGSVSYERTNFMPTILQSGDGSGLSLFDANTVVSATIAYPVTENLDLSLLYTTTAHRDASGNLVYPDGPTGLPQLDTSLSIMTQIHL
jgi:hypothetical protein